MENKIKSDGSEIYGKEFGILEKHTSLLADKGISPPQMKEAYAELIKDYQSLLKDTVKMTRISDSSQRKLMKANEKIANLNEQLTDSEKNIKELNTILMHYIKVTDK